MKMMDLNICNHFSCIQKSDIVIYGTGHWGEQAFRILKKANINILSVCNTEKADNLFHNYSVLSIKDIKEKYDKSTVLIIIASLDYYKEMIKVFYMLKCVLFMPFISRFLCIATIRVCQRIYALKWHIVYG